MPEPDRSLGQLIPFRKRRSYLEACRDQGVYCVTEELQAQLSDKMRELAVLKAEHSAEIIQLTDHSETASAFVNALAEQKQDITTRLQAICQAYQDAGLGDPFFPLLKHMLFDETSASSAAGVFAAAMAPPRAQAAAPEPASPLADTHPAAAMAGTHLS
jgi:hypothetical protein